MKLAHKIMKIETLWGLQLENRPRLSRNFQSKTGLENLEATNVRPRTWGSDVHRQRKPHDLKMESELACSLIVHHLGSGGTE